MTKAVILKEAKVVSETPAVLLDKQAQEVELLIADFNEAKRVMKQMEAQKSAAEAKLRELMCEAQVGLINGVERIKIASRTRQDINKEDLKNVFPEAYELCLKETTYTVVTAVS
jgi:predicted phage-related endonuclease